MNNVTVAFLITLFAGLATGIGSLIAFLAKSTNKKFLSVSLGFSAGVMIYVSMVEIFVKAKDSLILARGEKIGGWLTVIAFFVGMFLIALIDKVVPSGENPHEVKLLPSEEDEEERNKKGLLRTGLFTALAIAIHNFPEGLATFVSALSDMKIAIPIAVAIAIHNIPEGISVSVPIYYATGDKKKAFMYSFLSGMAEPIGAIVGYFLLRNFFSDLSFGIIFAMVAGIMVFISLDELLPAAKEYGEHHLSIYGLILGMIVMAVSLLLFI
ncbi:zinc transporter ZupT [Clostridium sp.]|uniref:zinc transporter ZupT n=1 Tax=Clostridium sp. TaxID=1506 RepID=UPI0025C564A9|nr:zinc transporter ZupT [Clostridium sp.]